MIAIRLLKAGRRTRELGIFAGEDYLGGVIRSGMRRSTFELEGVTYRVEKNPRDVGMVLLRDRQPLARARRRGILKARFQVDAVGGRYRMLPRPWFRRGFRILRGPRLVGSIEPERPFATDAIGRFPPELPLPERVFMTLLAVVEWRSA